MEAGGIMTPRNSNASRRFLHPAKQKLARATKRLLPSSTREKQEQPSSNVLLVSPQTAAYSTQRESENKPNASPSDNPASSPKPFDRDKENTMTVKEAAFLLKKHQDTVYRWLREGRLRGWQPGGRGCGVLVCEASVKEALKCQMGSSGSVRTA